MSPRRKGARYQICTRCVMDTSDPDITFDERGLCSHCRYADLDAERRLSRPETKQRLLEEMKATVRAAGTSREYDCVIGVSGGVDSSYLAYLTVREFGLRPIAVHLDNGWNSKLAVGNIQKIARKLDIDLVTHVIDWEEFRELQRAYLKASVIDIESITDHAIRAILYQVADDHGIKHILLGSNRATELILPINWGFNNNDVVNLRAIHRRFASIPLRTFPQLGHDRLRYYRRERGIEMHSPLDWVRYVREDAMRTLIRELGWVNYGNKHCESLFTKFYQAYILVEKFKVDKRRAHLSTMINFQQLTRDDALAELAKPAYPPDELAHDLEYVVKKLEFSRAEFDQIMQAPPRSHFDYASDLESKLLYLVYPRIKPLYRELRRHAERALPEPVVRQLRHRLERLLPP